MKMHHHKKYHAGFAAFSVIAAILAMTTVGLAMGGAWPFPSPKKEKLTAVQTVIATLQQTSGMKPEKITLYTLRGEQMLLAEMPCCDHFNPLFNSKLNIICAPSGGFAGVGDGKCRDFEKEKQGGRVIWEQKTADATATDSLPQLHFPLLKPQISFLVVGDFGEGNASQKRVAALMEKICERENPEAILTTGDNIYPDGVGTEIDAQWKTKFENIYNFPCLSQKSWIPVLGNHDHHNNPDAQAAYSKVNPRWLMPARTFAVHYENLLSVFAADTNTHYPCKAPDCGYTALSDSAQKSAAKWKIVLGHHPLVSAGRHQSVPAGLPEKLTSLYCKNNLDFHFAGHDHNLQHNIANMKGSACSINLVITGAGGAWLYNTKPIPEVTKFARKAHGFALFTVNEKRATVEFYSTEKSDKPIYTYHREK